MVADEVGLLVGFGSPRLRFALSTPPVILAVGIWYMVYMMYATRVADADAPVRSYTRMDHLRGIYCCAILVTTFTDLLMIFLRIQAARAFAICPLTVALLVSVVLEFLEIGV